MKSSILIWFLFFFTTYSYSQIGEYEELNDIEVTEGASFYIGKSKGR